MNDLFDGVIYAGIDTDKHKYPIGKKIFSLRFFVFAERLKQLSYRDFSCGQC